MFKHRRGPLPRSGIGPSVHVKRGNAQQHAHAGEVTASEGVYPPDSRTVSPQTVALGFATESRK